jgi:hypothetical protein
MFGFGGGFNGPGGGGTRSGASSAPSGRSTPSPSAGREGTGGGPGGPAGTNRNSGTNRSSPSKSGSSSSAGREGTGGGPGGPAGTGRNSGTNGPSGQGYSGGGREGTGGGPGGPAGTGRTSGGQEAKGDRLGSTGFAGSNAPTRGFNLSQPAPSNSSMRVNGMLPSAGSLDDPRVGPKIGIDGRRTDVGSLRIGGLQPIGATERVTGVDATPKGFGSYVPGASMRALENDSMEKYARMVDEAGAQRLAAHMTAQTAEAFRAAEISTMAAMDKQRRADMAVAARGSEITSMNALQRMQETDRAEQARLSEIRSMSQYADEVARVQRQNIGAHQEAADSMLSVGIGGVGGKLGLTDAFLGPIVDRMIGVESANNPKAKNPNSTATGLGQFISSTWTNMMEKYRPDLASKLTKAEQLALRTDPVISREMTTNYAIENAQHLAKNGVEVTPSSVYAAHFLGPDGAVKAYKAPRSNSAASVLGAAAVRSNRSIMQGKTIGDVLSYVDRKMKGTIADRPVFTDRYLAADAKPVSDRERGLVNADYFGSQPNDDWGDGTVEVAAIDAPAQGGGVPAPAPAPAPAAPVNPPRGFPEAAGNAPVAPPDQEFPDRPRSIQSALIAGGIDVLSTLVPGVGQYAGIVNAGLQLTGNRTIGERVVDAFNDGDFVGGSSGAGGRDSGEGSGRRVALEKHAPKVVKPGATVKAPAFADKYLEPPNTFLNDPVKRPTPAQRWGEGGNQSTYAEYS